MTLRDHGAVRAIALHYGKGSLQPLALEIWPTKEDRAGEWLGDCLNRDRSAKLDPEELLYIFKIGKDQGIHIGMYFFADDLGYNRPAPIEPEDQEAEQRRQIHRLLDEVNHRIAKLERIEDAKALKAVS